MEREGNMEPKGLKMWLTQLVCINSFDGIDLKNEVLSMCTTYASDVHSYASHVHHLCIDLFPLGCAPRMHQMCIDAMQRRPLRENHVFGNFTM